MAASATAGVIDEGEDPKGAMVRKLYEETGYRYNESKPWVPEYMKKRKDNRLSLNKELFKKVYRIRRAEKAIKDYYLEDDMKTPMHMSMGEEAITAGVCAALGRHNQAFGYYRSHALYISKTDETDAFFAEMYGRVTGVVRGRGGSMHLAAPE